MLDALRAGKGAEGEPAQARWQITCAALLRQHPSSMLDAADLFQEWAISVPHGPLLLHAATTGMALQCCYDWLRPRDGVEAKQGAALLDNLLDTLLARATEAVEKATRLPKDQPWGESVWAADDTNEVVKMFDGIAELETLDSVHDDAALLLGDLARLLVGSLTPDGFSRSWPPLRERHHLNSGIDSRLIARNLDASHSDFALLVAIDATGDPLQAGRLVDELLAGATNTPALVTALRTLDFVPGMDRARRRRTTQT